MTEDDLLRKMLLSYYKPMTHQEFKDAGGVQPLGDWLGMDRNHTDNVIELILLGWDYKPSCPDRCVNKDIQCELCYKKSHFKKKEESV